jgi:c(7)-type cytochrome triheme protein
MKNMSMCIIMVVAAAFCSGSAWAVPWGKSIEFEGGGTGKVVFDGTFHADQGLLCKDCHPKIFPMKKGSVKLTMADLNAGKRCGECHNGTRAFKTGDAANCTRCHKR